MKTISSNLYVATIVLVTFLLASCQKRDDLVEPTVPATENKKMDDLKVADTFNWSTLSTYTIQVTGYANAPMKVYGADGKLLHTAMLKKDQPVTLLLSIPATEVSVVLHFLGEQTELELVTSPIQLTL
ncbi:MAG: hypothetical protein PHQ65_08090 [Bacteroidales bacterium]|nr:hypothetical protein [Bacteroidales bacterium]MDD3665211.1 hypothetical protein [Bacteroidales bacterium]